MPPRREGTVLIVAMWVVLVLAGLVLVFARAMRVEAIASANQVASQQAQCIAQGALRFVLANVETDPASACDIPCEKLNIGDGCFWILRTNSEDDRRSEAAFAFGITDESTRINLNSASRDTLLKLPGITAELAAAIVDWRDADSEVSPGGAENEYYLLLEDSRYCKNGPFETVDEILLVKGADTSVLAGEDANRNGVLDANENDASDSEPPDNRDGDLDRGLYDYLTVYTREPNTTATGEERVNVNDSSTRALSNLLRDVVAEERFFQTMDRVRMLRPFSNVIDFYFDTGITMEEFKQIADRLTTSSEKMLEGRININRAPREVLLCLPELDESDVDALLDGRGGSRTAPTPGGGADISTIAWVAEALPREKAIAIGGHITTRSCQFSADIVALSGDGRAWKRYLAVIDAREGPPRVVLWKDLTHLGWPLDSEIIASARRGSP